MTKQQIVNELVSSSQHVGVYAVEYDISPNNGHVFIAIRTAKGTLNLYQVSELGQPVSIESILRKMDVSKGIAIIRIDNAVINIDNALKLVQPMPKK